MTDSPNDEEQRQRERDSDSRHKDDPDLLDLIKQYRNEPDLTRDRDNIVRVDAEQNTVRRQLFSLYFVKKTIGWVGVGLLISIIFRSGQHLPQIVWWSVLIVAAALILYGVREFVSRKKDEQLHRRRRQAIEAVLWERGIG